MRALPLLLLIVALSGCDAITTPATSANDAAKKPISSRERSLIYAADGAAQQGNIAAAERDYMAAMKENSGHIDAHLGLAQLYLNNNQRSKALTVLEEALERAPDHAFANYLTGKLYMDENRHDDAIAMFDRGLTTAPDNLDLATGKGIILDMQGKHNAAQMLYMRAIKTNPNASLTNVRTNLGMSYLLSGEPQKTIDILKNEGTRTDAPNVTRHNLALAYGMLSQQAQAKKLLKGEMDDATLQLAIARMREYVAEHKAGEKPPLKAPISESKSSPAPAAKKPEKPAAKPASKSTTSAKPSASTR